MFGATAAAAAPAAEQGPSSSQTPYLVRNTPGVVTKAVLTSGDSVGGYRMAGIPDGLGAFDNGDGTFTVVMNHELGSGVGAVRAHGAKGAFVSKWVVDKDTLEVLSGSDLMQKVWTWNATTQAWVQTTTAFNRFCSADLAPVSAFYDETTAKGTTNRLFLNGEEAGSEGRAVGHVVTGPDAGSSYVLPWLGRFSWENAVALADSGPQTVVVGTDDSTPGQVYVYVGTKQATGNDVERAGLTNGKLYGVKIAGLSTETDTTTIPAGGSAFSLVEIPGAATMTGAQLEAASNALGITRMNRPEDSSWDPSRRAGLYFATTASFTGISRLWNLSFANPADVLAGGVATIAVAGPAFAPAKSNADQAGPRMMDNVTVNSRGQVLMQEDVGNNAYLGAIWMYDPATGNTARIVEHDPDRFTAGGSHFLTQDEESSGIIPAPFLGQGKYLADVQAHYATDAETVEGGQLLVLQVPPGKPVR
jgi:hypothetical protein